jgi:Fe-S oxidoreductase
MLMLEGCVQPALWPNTNAAAARVLDRLGISIVNAAQAGCCGASPFTAHARCSMRRSQAARSSRACSGSASICRMCPMHVPDGHLCCGSAGTYSITQPELAQRLRKLGLDALESGKPEWIGTAKHRLPDAP